MARLIGPDDSVRAVYLPNGLVKARGLPLRFYLDEQLTELADVLSLTGETLAESSTQVDEWSRWPLVQYPDDVKVLYGSVAGGPAVPLPARIPAQLDDLDARIADVGAAAGEATEAVADDLAALSAVVATIPGALPPVTYLDAYNGFFGGVGWVNAQGNTATTLSAPAAQGATTLTVTSATGLLNGVLLVTGAGTAAQQLLTITNVASNVLTVSPAVGTALANGATVAPVWTNSSHITWDSVGGSKAYGYWVANAKRADGSYVISGGAGQTVVWLGDSWTAEALTEFNAELDARLGATNVVNAGVPGNKLSQMIARFSTDVAPLNPDYVVLEYGVNDVYQGVTAATMAAELEAAVALCRSVGAAVVLPGVPPLTDYPAQSRDRNVELRGQTAGPDFPSVTAAGLADRLAPTPRNASSVRFGDGAQPLATGVNNTAVGSNAQALLTTGVNNTAIGKDTQAKITTTNYSTAIGQGTQFNATGGFNTGIGALSQFSLTSGVGNIGIGYGAQYSPATVTANASTTASYQTCIGYQAGQAGTAQDDRITTIGYQSVASGAASTAVGSQSSATVSGASAFGATAAATAGNTLALGYGAAASHLGAVAIGRDSSGTSAVSAANNDFVLGTANHVVQVPGTLRLPAATTAKSSLRIPHGAAPTSPVDGDMWTTTAGLFVRINGVTRQVTVT